MNENIKGKSEIGKELIFIRKSLYFRIFKKVQNPFVPLILVILPSKAP